VHRKKAALERQDQIKSMETRRLRATRGAKETNLNLEGSVYVQHEAGSFTHREQGLLQFEVRGNVENVNTEELAPRWFVGPDVDHVVQNGQRCFPHFLQHVAQYCLRRNGGGVRGFEQQKRSRIYFFIGLSSYLALCALFIFPTTTAN